MAAAGLQICSKGNIMIGRSDVTAIGTVSKHHHSAIQTNIPRQARPAAENSVTVPSANVYVAGMPI